MRILSVDLGTSNTVAVLSAHGRPPAVLELDGSVTMPSAVFAAQDGTLVVGREAVRRARTDPARFEPNPKRRIDEGTLLLGDRVIAVTEVLSAVLGRVHAEVVRQLGGAVPDEVRLTHPAQWGPMRRNALLSAARQAGMPHNLMLIPEPVAAAAHFASFPGQALPPGQALVIYDLGAGTFDVGIVAAQQQGFTVLAEAGLPDLGGLDVDHALLTRIGQQVAGRDPAAWYRLQRPESTPDRRAARLFHEDVRAAKEALSAHPQTEVALPKPFGDALVTRPELEAAIRPKLAESVQLLATTMNSAGLTPANLAGVYLVGGSSRIPLVATMISEQLRVVPTSLDAPETAVALGAHLLPRPGTTMRTDTVAAAPSPPPQPPPPQWQQPGVTQPRPRKKKRLVLLALLAVLVLGGAATTYVLVNSGGPTGPKYDAAKMPTCDSFPVPVPGAKAKPPQVNDDGTGLRIVTCEYTTSADEPGVPYESASIKYNVERPRGRKSPEDVAKELYEAEVHGYGVVPKSVNLGYGELATLIKYEAGWGDLVLVDQNLIIEVAYNANPPESKSAEECVAGAQNVMRQAWDASQPK